MNSMLRPILVIALLALCAGGCLSVGKGAPALEKVHALDSAEIPAVKGVTAPPLAVRSFAGRRRFDDRVVLREASGDVVLSETEHWAEPPVDAATDAVREALAGSGMFERVFPSSAGYRAALTLDGYVLACDLVQTQSGPWKALFRARLDLFEAKQDQLVASGVYEGTTDLGGASSQGLGPAMGAAVGKMLAAAVADWRARGVLK